VDGQFDMKNLLLLLVIFCFSTFVSLRAIATPYTIGDSGFIDNGWAKPLNRTLTTNTNYDYDSSTYYSNFGFHHGAVDIVASYGESVYAIDDGEIVKLYRDGNSSRENVSVLYVKHKTSTGKEFLAIYGHSYTIAGLFVGSTVKKGQKIGTIKRFGSPDHIHFGIGLDVNCHTQRFGGIKCSIVDPINFLKTNRNTSVSVPTAVVYINQCINKFSNYFGTKDGSAEVCFGDFYCQDTTGRIVSIAVHKSERDVFWYLWYPGNGEWNTENLSSCH
jgi:hypothetical protein